jgi:putative FmdB family regulatory protein
MGMPNYDYVCCGCNAPFEALVAGPRSRPSCPHCGARRANRLPALVALRRDARSSPALPTNGRPAQGCGLIERPSDFGDSGDCGHCGPDLP